MNGMHTLKSYAERVKFQRVFSVVKLEQKAAQFVGVIMRLGFVLVSYRSEFMCTQLWCKLNWNAG